MVHLPRRWALGWLVTAAVLVAPASGWAQRKRIPFSDEAMEKAIEKAKKFLWSQYIEKEGHWKEPPLPDPNDPKNANKHNYHGGYTSLACLALLSENPKCYNDKRMKRALEFLAGVKMNATYCLGLRAQIWSILPRKMSRALLKKDADQLVASICQPKPGQKIGSDPTVFKRYGTYTYLSTGKIGPGGDHSNTQFGILGVWAAARHNIEVPQKYWELVFRHYVAVQNPEGGWGYSPAGGGTSNTMTAAGLASMYVAFDNVYQDQFLKCGTNPVIPAIQNALNWFDKNYVPSRSGYYMYGVERVGLASGYKYFGKKDWYKLGATALINAQGGNGGWGNLVNTTFITMFLVRGRHPVLFNRLEYEGDWHNRPRALANLTRWISRTFERTVNWQIVNLKTPVNDWHDAPILLITGSKKPTFTDADLEKLRTFIWQGGMLLSVAECGNQGQPFDAGMRQVYRKLFPQYEMKILPPDHEVYSSRFTLKRGARLWGISNGVRTLAMHCREDLPREWQRNAYTSSSFKMAANIFFYATDLGALRHRGTTLWPKAEAFVPLRVAKVARIKHAGNWNPEPLAWERFRLMMGRDHQTKVILSDPMAAADLDAKAWRVAALTGTGTLTLTDKDKTALKAYVTDGGTLIVDAAGGSKTFADSATAVVQQVFGSGLRRLPAYSAVWQMSGLEVGSVKYRRAARLRLGKTTYPRIQAIEVNGRPAVFVSKEDVTAGLVGFPSYTCLGYAPDSALGLMRNMVLYGIRVNKSATSQTAAK